ncbi:MAG: fumarylacetoacetate hydrolase family protein [Pseudonocardiales bacterium]|nr:fumarylacetoacetate hydrolase family protein [Pseudonocardiales bacterium]
MSTSVLRTADGWWVATPAGAARIAIDARTTAELLAERAAVVAAGNSTDTVPVESLALVSPVTVPCRVVAQATNYASHVRDVGMNPDQTQLTFFRKASGSICGPYDDIIRPAHVKLLDYELEIGLVIGRELPVGTAITTDNWKDYVAALIVTNDVSARDVQLSKVQFFESKSYPTFTPVGPALVLVNGDELKRFDDLRLQLSVNGELRQNAIVGGDMLFPPVEALQALSRFQRLEPGDLILTGTPAGTALTSGGKQMELKAFLAAQADNPNFLHDGDVIEATIGADDGAVDLGRQRNTVRNAR